MDATNNFSPSFIGKKVTFINGVGTWVLRSKVFENSCQYTEEDVEEVEGISCAYGTFTCANVENTSEKAVMRIFMQIPHIGPPYRTRQEISQQASQMLDLYSRSEIDGYKMLRDAGCKSVRPALGCKKLMQDTNGMVPGGYIVFLLLGDVQGVQLSHSTYWNLEFLEREEIRLAFRIAWEDCVKAGIYVNNTFLDCLIWDKSLRKIYITGIQGCEPAEPKHVWSDILWLAWGLAQPPEGYRFSKETKVHPDTSGWKM